MPRRNVVLATNEFYHVFNRSVGKEYIFSLKKNLNRVVEIIDHYRFPQRIKFSQFKNFSKDLKNGYLLSLKKLSPLVEIYAFAFMPNHYHLLVKQIQEKGIIKFISNFQNSFAKYFNLKNNRHGTLFQNSFSAKRIEAEEEFIHISRYIHLNPVTSYLIEFDRLANYPWTSYPYYLDSKKNQLVNTQVLLKIFGSKKRFVEFVSNQVDYQRKLATIKNLIIE